MSNQHEVDEAAAKLAEAMKTLRESEPQHIESFEKQDVLAHEASAAWSISYTTQQAVTEDVEAHQASSAWSISYTTQQAVTEDVEAHEESTAWSISYTTQRD